MTNTLVQIPIIDFQPFLTGDSAAKHDIAQQIYQACHQIGFFYLKNPGIPSQLLEELFVQTKAFFDLPDAAKQQIAWNNELSNRGYVGIERERLDPAKPGDLKEAFNVGKEINPQLILNQWLPDRESPKDADYTVHRIILGTHTSGQAPDHLMIAEVLLPKSPLEIPGKEASDLYDEDRQGWLQSIMGAPPWGAQSPAGGRRCGGPIARSRCAWPARAPAASAARPWR